MLDKIINAVTTGKITQAELSRRSGVDTATISQIITGQTKNPRIATYAALSAVVDALENTPQPEGPVSEGADRSGSCADGQGRDADTVPAAGECQAGVA